jgi:hypothetical protein
MASITKIMQELLTIHATIKGIASSSSKEKYNDSASCFAKTAAIKKISGPEKMLNRIRVLLVVCQTDGTGYF